MPLCSLRIGADLRRPRRDGLFACRSGDGGVVLPSIGGRFLFDGRSHRAWPKTSFFVAALAPHRDGVPFVARRPFVRWTRSPRPLCCSVSARGHGKRADDRARAPRPGSPAISRMRSHDRGDRLMLALRRDLIRRASWAMLDLLVTRACSFFMGPPCVFGWPGTQAPYNQKSWCAARGCCTDLRSFSAQRYILSSAINVWIRSADAVDNVSTRSPPLSCRGRLLLHARSPSRRASLRPPRVVADGQQPADPIFVRAHHGRHLRLSAASRGTRHARGGLTVRVMCPLALARAALRRRRSAGAMGSAGALAVIWPISIWRSIFRTTGRHPSGP